MKRGTPAADRHQAVSSHSPRVLARRTAIALAATLVVASVGGAVGVMAVRSLPQGQWERKVMDATLGDPASQAAVEAAIAAGWEVERQVNRRRSGSIRITFHLRRRPPDAAGE